MNLGSMEHASPPIIDVVDDDAGLRRALVRLLKAWGFRTACFGSGGEYLASARDVPDCLVLDLHLGDMSGFELEARLREAGLLPPTLFLTAHQDLAEEARERGRLCLAKPFDERELLEAYSRLIISPEG